MTILLINDNPVVSRLLALCTRDDDILLEEVKSVHTIENESYDVVLIDEESYIGEVLSISEMIHIGKKILLSAVDVEVNDFDKTLQKPFLPSQIIEILESIKMSQEYEGEVDTKTFSIFPLEGDTSNLDEVQLAKKKDAHQVLDENELEKIKTLLEMDDDVDMIDLLSEEEIETRKVEAIKEQLIADGLEIVEEEEIVEGLSAPDDSIVFSNKKKKLKKKKEKKSITFTEEELEQIEDAVQVAIATLKRKQMKKLLKGKKVEISIALEDIY